MDIKLIAKLLVVKTQDTQNAQKALDTGQAPTAADADPTGA
jgi:hypothetical protein